MNAPLHLWLIPILPLAGFLINGILGSRLPKWLVSTVALLAPLGAFAVVLSRASDFLGTVTAPFTETCPNPWINIGTLHVDFSLVLDQLSLVMLLVITGVGFLIHIYSVGYMAHDKAYWRFFAYLNLFLFFMTTLVLAGNVLLMFVGWEGVGLASYLLIGFWFTKKSAADAGRKAFVVNRIGDFGFLLAMFLLINHFGTLSFTQVFAAIQRQPELHGGFLTAIALLLVVGAAGKSAQIPLYVWLPDAMEGPTPVSALIHAATMVTAGVYLVARSHVLFDRSPFALGVIAIIGAATALFAATIGAVQHDIKRVLAYSTISQLGYMFLGCGVAAYGAAVFHLMTHAFFKALLFLAAGSVIHALSGEQDMRVMGGLRKRIPVTFWTMTAGVIAIAGIWPFAGFFSKDEILWQTFSHTENPLHYLLWAVGLITAGLTSFYMFRLWFKTFFGAERFDEHHLGGAHGHAAHTGEDEHDDSQAHGHHGVHESPWVMLAPLAILAILSVIGGWVGVPAAQFGHDEIGHFLAPVFAPAHAAAEETASRGMELGLAGISLLTAILGFLAAYVFYYKKPGTLGANADRNPIYKLVANKYYVDEIYHYAIVTPVLVISRLVFGALIDGGLISGSGAFVAFLTRQAGNGTRRMQSGNIRSYAGWLAAGAAAVILLMTYSALTQHATKAALHLK
ncbi:MAG TPA: NADH-quinone oxidoreductase subunit L [Terriglobus sp.]